MKCVVIFVGLRTPCSTLVTSSLGAACQSPASWMPMPQRATLASKRQTLPLRPWTTCPPLPPHLNSAGEKPSVVSHHRAAPVLNLFYSCETPSSCSVSVLSDSVLGSDEEGFSEVFLPTDSDYDSSDALSPRELDLLYSPPQDLSQQALHSLGGSAPDVLQIHELRWLTCSEIIREQCELSKLSCELYTWMMSSVF